MRTPAGFRCWQYLYQGDVRGSSTTTMRSAPPLLYQCAANNTLLAQLIANSASAVHPIIQINFSTSPHAIQYTFAAATDSYTRVMGGAPHIDRNPSR